VQSKFVVQGGRSTTTTNATCNTTSTSNATGTTNATSTTGTTSTTSTTSATSTTSTTRTTSVAILRTMETPGQAQISMLPKKCKYHEKIMNLI
jgi:hypothetical protein